MHCYTGMPSNKHVTMRDGTVTQIICLSSKLLNSVAQEVHNTPRQPHKLNAESRTILTSYNMEHEQILFLGASSTFFSVYTQTKNFQQMKGQPVL